MRIPSVVFSDTNRLDEQQARALAIHEVIGNDLEEHYEQQWSYLKITLVAAMIATVIGIALIGTGQAGVGLSVAGIGIIAGVGGSAYVRTRSPDVTVSSVEKGYWTGHLVPDDDGTVVFDATESINPEQFQLNLLEEPEHAERVEETLDSIQDFPVVMTEDRDVENEFVDTLDSIKTEIENSQTHEVTSPVLQNDDPAVESLSRLASVADEGVVDAGGISLSRQEAAEQVRTFDEFESMANEDHGESVLLNVSEQSRRIANDLSGLQETATELLNEHIQTAGDMFGLVSHHFYCPDCMNDEIESRLEVRDDGDWYCRTCRSSFAPSEGIPRHRIRDDIVLDVWEQLWIEKDDERRQIYESIEDQKAELKEREYEQQREEIRTVEDRIKDIRSKIRDLQTEARAKQGTVEVMSDLMDKYERINEQRLNEFERDVAQAFEEIDAETERVLEETEGIVEDRIEEAEKQAEERAEMMREEERQRQREFLAAQQALQEDREARKQVAENVNTARVVSAIERNNENRPERRGA